MSDKELMQNVECFLHLVSTSKDRSLIPSPQIERKLVGLGVSDLVSYASPLDFADEVNFFRAYEDTRLAVRAWMGELNEEIWPAGHGSATTPFVCRGAADSEAAPFVCRGAADGDSTPFVCRGASDLHATPLVCRGASDIGASPFVCRGASDEGAVTFSPIA